MADNGLDKFVTGLLAGALIGTAIGMLMAPKPGSETRQIVRERAGEYLDTARERAGGYVGTARERVQNIRRSNRPDIDDEPIPSQVIEAE